MKKIILSFLTFSLTFSNVILWSQKGKTLEISSFQKIEILGNFEVELLASDKNSISLLGNEEETSRVKIVVKGDVLRISDLKSVNQKTDIKIIIQYKKLESILVSANAYVHHKGEFKTDKIKIVCSSGGKIESKLFGTNLEATVDKGGTISLNGKVAFADIESSTGGIFDAFELECDSIIVRSNAGGLAKVFVKKYLAANAIAGGEIYFRGIPKNFNPKKTMGGKIEQMLE